MEEHPYINEGRLSSGRRQVTLKHSVAAENRGLTARTGTGMMNTS